jgi:hypothetical protein
MYVHQLVVMRPFVHIRYSRPKPNGSLQLLLLLLLLLDAPATMFANQSDQGMCMLTPTHLGRLQ